MEILFQNNYVRNREFVRAVLVNSLFRHPFIIAIDVFFGLNLVFSLMRETIEVFSVLFPIIWFATKVLIFIKNVNIVLKRDLEMHGKPVEITMTVLNDNIRQRLSTGSETRFNYTDIKRAVQTKKYIYLFTKSKLILSFEKDSFSIGNEHEFLLFLKNKGVKVKKGRFS